MAMETSAMLIMDLISSYGLDIFPINLNHTVESIAKLLRDLELPPKYSLRELFFGSGSAPLFTALLTGAEMCTSSLPR